MKPTPTDRKAAFTPSPLKQQQVAEGLRTLVAQLSPGDRLPSVPELKQHFGMSTNTVEAGIEMLRRDGLVVRRRGAGTFVAERTEAPTQRLVVSEPVKSTTEKTLAVLVSAETPFYHRCVQYLTVQAALSDLAVECRYANSPNAMAPEQIARFIAHGPHGILVLGYQLEPVALDLLAQNQRVVMIGEPPLSTVPQAPSVFSDAEQGGYLATRYLIDLGHRRIVFAYRGFDNNYVFQQRRWRGHVRALTEAGLLQNEEPRLIDGNVLNLWRSDLQTARDYFTQADAPTAVVTYSDPTAVQVVGTLAAAGVRIPQDVSVLGYDNLPEGEFYNPPLTTVDQKIEAQIRHALALLAVPGENGGASWTGIVPTLVERASCAPPIR